MQSLPASDLVTLLLYATKLHPTLAIFPATILTGANISNSTHISTASAPPVVVAEEEETYDLYPSSGALPYPKAGNGVPLPREKNDLAFLIDDDSLTFSHVVGWDPRDLHGGSDRGKWIGSDRAIGVGA